MNGITKNAMFHVRFGGIVNDHTGNKKAGFSISGKISRKDWGLLGIQHWTPVALYYSDTSLLHAKSNL